MNEPPKTEPLVPLSLLTDLALLGQRAARVFRIYLVRQRNSLPRDAEYREAVYLLKRLDDEAHAALQRDRAPLPGFDQ